MLRKALIGLVFVLPVGLLAWRQYGEFALAHVGGGREGPAATATATRPAWATPLARPGLTNLYRVSDDLYRGAQPTAEGVRNLAALGVRTVINLRRFRSDRDEIARTPIGYVHINVNPFDPDDEDVVEFLRAVGDANRLPAFVHCKRGIDRTGMMCAIYRVAVCGWSKADALAEMTEGPFGYDAIFRNVAEYVWRMDMEDLKRRARQ